MICRECETVAHCTKHGCIPKVDRTIDMASEAGLNDEVLVPWAFEIKAFEALVRADERSVEREACAQICVELDKHSQSQWPRRIETMIRARGNT